MISAATRPLAARRDRFRDPCSFLPLTPRVYHVLLALAESPLHGYGVILAVQNLTDGVIVMRTGTLYVLQRRLLDRRLIEEYDQRPEPDADDERRRYYRVTKLGRAVLRGVVQGAPRVVVRERSHPQKMIVAGYSTLSA